MVDYWSLFTPAELNDVCSTWHNVLVYDISKHQALLFLVIFTCITQVMLEVMS